MKHEFTEPVSKSVTALNDQCKTEKKKKKNKTTMYCSQSTESQKTGNCDRVQCFKIKYTTVEPKTKRWSLKHKICPKFQMAHVNCGFGSTIKCGSQALPTNYKRTEQKTAIKRPTPRGSAYTCISHTSCGTETPKCSSSSSTFSCPDGHTETGDGMAIVEPDGVDDGFQQPQPPSMTSDEETAAYAETATDGLEVLDEAATSVAGGTEKDTDVGEPVTRRVTTKETVHPRFSIVSPISKRRSSEYRRSRTSEFHRIYDDDDDDNSIGKDNGVRPDLATGQTD